VGEILVEIVATSVGEGFLEPQPLVGPFPSGAPYDVLFVADGHDVTSAELPPDEKDAISHRGKALRRIAPVVAEALRPAPAQG
jgi:inosine/xanthosine triphosphate pyrophosphatase family protein